MKRKLKSCEQFQSKRKCFKYQYTPDMKGQPVPLHYLYDRLATDEQIDRLNKQLELRKCIYDNLCLESHFILQSLSDVEKSKMDTYIFGLIDDEFPRWYIEEEIEYYIEDNLNF